MGHRANFVSIRKGQAIAFQDQWAALGSTYLFAEGPEAASAAIEAMEPTSELMDWAFAEAGYLLDFDERRAIVFGTPEEVDLEFDDMGELGLEVTGDEIAAASELQSALRQGPLGFLQCIAPRWSGWLLHWDDRGVDAFAEHLERRGIRTLTTQPPSHPADRQTFTLQA
jgi:hypothetical protein